MVDDDDEFSWVTVEADSILGVARPKTAEALLKKTTGVWHQLYRDWLAAYHPRQSAAFEFVAEAGGRPRLQGRQRYDRHLAALSETYDEFYEAVGELKQALDDRTGTARRLAHFAGNAAAAAQDVARSKTVTSMAKAVGAEPLQKAAAGAAGRVRTAAGPSGPQSVEVAETAEKYEAAVFAAANWFAVTPDLDTYLEWLAVLTDRLSAFGGRLGEHGGWLATTAQDVVGWRLELSNRLVGEPVLASVREAVYWLAYHVDLLAYPSGGETPQRAVWSLVNDLHERSAIVLYQYVRPMLEELLGQLDSAYYYGGLALDHAARAIAQRVPGYPGDAFEPWAQHQLTMYRTELAGQSLPGDTVEENETDADEAAALEFFGQSIDQFR